MKKYMYTYKITCLKGSLKNHYYYGKHCTDDLNDGYHGSGKIIKSYYKKYGAIEGETYTKSILQFFNNLDELNEAEIKLIGNNYIDDDNCLNLTPGGTGGFCIMTDEIRSKISNTLKSKDKSFWEKRPKPMLGRNHSKETKHKMRTSHLGKKGTSHTAWNKGQQMTEEVKQKIRDNAKNNPQYGNKGRKFSVESKQKMSQSAKTRKRKPLSNETKEKIRNSIKSWWAKNKEDKK